MRNFQLILNILVPQLRRQLNKAEYKGQRFQVFKYFNSTPKSMPGGKPGFHSSEKDDYILTVSNDPSNIQLRNTDVFGKITRTYIQSLLAKMESKR